MERQALKDRSGKLLGYIQPYSGDKNKLEGRDPSGKLKGTYDPHANKTYSPSGTLVGTGNLLSNLIMEL